MKFDSPFDPTQPFQVYSRGILNHFFTVESKSLDASIFEKNHFRILRDHVVRLIFINSRKDGFDAYIPYLAVIYFDHFISRNPLPIIEDKDLKYRAMLLSICCLSLAWKMRDHSFKFSDFLMEREHLDLDRDHIMEIELKILNGLEWEMRPVTPLCFVPYFMSMTLISGSNFRGICEIIIQAQGDINFTQFEPSVLAVAAILTSLHCHSPQSDSSINIFRDILLRGGIAKLDDRMVTRCIQEMIGMWECMRKNQENVPKMPTDGASSSKVAAEESTTDDDVPKMATDCASSSQVAAEESTTDDNVSNMATDGSSLCEVTVEERTTDDNVSNMATDGSSLSEVTVEERTTDDNVSKMATDGSSSSEVAGKETTIDYTLNKFFFDFDPNEDPVFINRRAGKEIISEREEEKVQMPHLLEVPVAALFSEKTDTMNLDFNLKWITNEDEDLLMTLDPALFLPETKTKHRSIRTWLKTKLCMCTVVEEHQEDEA